MLRINFFTFFLSRYDGFYVGTDTYIMSYEKDFTKYIRLVMFVL